MFYTHIYTHPFSQRPFSPSLHFSHFPYPPALPTPSLPQALGPFLSFKQEAESVREVGGGDEWGAGVSVFVPVPTSHLHTQTRTSALNRTE